jgi:hypothetical protein
LLRPRCGDRRLPERVDVDDPDADEHMVFVGWRPASREIRRQIEAG